MRTRAAWAVAGLAVAAFILDTAFTAAHRSLLSESTWAEHGWPLISLGGVGCAVMGSLIVSRHPTHRLGWLLCVASLICVTLAAEAYAVWVLDGSGPGPAYWGHAAGWIGSLLGWPAFTAIVLIFLYAPDGRVLSPRWRWAVWLTLAGLSLHTAGTLTIPPGEFVYGEQYGTRAVSGPLLNAGVALVAIGLIASATSLVFRLRRARDDARRQLLWIASSAVLLAVGVVIILGVPAVQGGQATLPAALPLAIAQLAFPVCVAVAVLRHRLGEIELIVNRTAALALATTLIAAAYVVVVVVVGLALGQGHGFLPSLLATALVALVFQPLRGWVVRAADRFAFGAAAAPYEALADFSRRLGDSPDAAALLPAVAEAAAHAVNATRVTVVLHVEAGDDRIAVWPPYGLGAVDADLDVAVVDSGERLGSMAVTMPAGRPLRAHEQRLLVDLAAQTAMAFRNARLTAEVSAQVEQLGDHTRQLAESRRRLITAGDAERRRLEEAISRQVVAHLVPLPERLRRLSGTRDAGPVAVDVQLLEQSTLALQAALEELREITRGVFPAQLARSGLPTALTSYLTRAGAGPANLVLDNAVRTRRFAPAVETTVYFCVTELVPEVRAPVVVSISASDRELRLVVNGARGAGTVPRAVTDRVETVGGQVSASVESGDSVVVVQLATSDAGSPPSGEPRALERARAER